MGPTLYDGTRVWRHTDKVEHFGAYAWLAIFRDSDIRLTAVRRLASEAADAGLLAPEIAAGKGA